jgi:hypothetical protein
MPCFGIVSYMQLALHEYNRWKFIMMLYFHVKYKMLHVIENCVQLVLNNNDNFQLHASFEKCQFLLMNLGILKLQVGSLKNLCHFNVVFIIVYKIYYKRKLVTLPKSDPWWIVWNIFFYNFTHTILSAICINHPLS